MRKEEIISKLEFTKDMIEFEKKSQEWTKKTYKQIIVIGIVVLLVIIISTSIMNNLNSWNVFSISLITCVTYKAIHDATMRKIDNKHNMQKLELDKNYYESLLELEENRVK